MEIYTDIVLRSFQLQEGRQSSPSGVDPEPSETSRKEKAYASSLLTACMDSECLGSPTGMPQSVQQMDASCLTRLLS